MQILEFLDKMTPIHAVALDFDRTGYVSDTFNAEVASEAFDGWSGDLEDEEEVGVMARLLETRPGQSLLDVACGYGRHALLFAQKYGLRATGIDIAPGLIEQARRLAQRAACEAKFEAMHGRELPWRDEFDHAIIGYNTFSVFSPKDAPVLLGKIHDALKSTGRLFLDVNNKPHYCAYGTCGRNWYRDARGLVLQETYFHHDVSVEVMRDVHVTDGGSVADEFICLKRIYDETELRALAEGAGFRVLRCYGNWDLTPCDATNPKVLLVLEK